MPQHQSISKRTIVAVLCAVGVLFGALGERIVAQRAAWQDEDFDFRRTVQIPAMQQPRVVVADFFAHGALRPDGSNLAVYSRDDVVSFRVMQIGPGDYCRIAFETVEKVTEYHIYYGGQGHVANVDMPKWTARIGLWMETRQWRNCDLNSLESVRAAYAQSRRYGSDFVPRVFHRHNPFDITPRPFLTRYVGVMNVPLTGKTTFFTSSQDASFLLVDGKLVVSAPGKHPLEPRAKIKGEIELEEGSHLFEYYHAASGEETCMVAAWQLPGFDEPAQISPAVFGDDHVAHIPATRLEHRGIGPMPDFRMAILGDVPSPEEDVPAMVRVQFVNTTTPSIMLNAKFQWQLGDGQSSEDENPGHVYLYPKYYNVTMTIHRGATDRRVTNRVQVIRSIIVEKEEDFDKLASYLPMLEQYNALHLDPVGLVQLVRAYLYVENWERAVRAGKMAFTPAATSHTDETRWDLAKLIGPVMRFKLDDAKGAAELYRAAASLIDRYEWKMASTVEAADTFLNDALMTAEAKSMLDMVSQRQQGLGSEVLSTFHRLRGDLLARTGDGKGALAAYLKAGTARNLPYDAIKQIAWQGAHSRSCESFLRDGEVERLRQELHAWQRNFPGDKTEGFLSLLMMGYWIQREKFPQAIAVASDLLTVKPNSPFADRLLYLTALCEGKRNQPARAAAVLQSLVTDYPGSPLVPRATEQLERLKDGSELVYDEFYPPPAKTDEVAAAEEDAK